MAASSLAACNVGPDFVAARFRPADDANSRTPLGDLVKDATASATTPKPPDPTWWKAFRDPT